MRKLLLMPFLAVMCLGIGLVLSCAEYYGDGADSSDDDAGDDDGSDDDAVNVDVPADDPDGVMTGQSVVEGQDLEVSASGTVQLEAAGTDVDPDGLDEACGAGCPLENANQGMLLIMIVPAEKAGPIFLAAGSNFSGQAPGSGDVGLIINDSDYSDNSGSFNADVVIESEPTDDDNADDDSASGDTWTDPSSGLTWQVTPSSEYLTWDDAKSYCENLSLAGGGWHLPTISELRTLIRGCDRTETGGSCGVTDSCLDSTCQDESCYPCNDGEGPNNGCYGPSELPGECDFWWSSSLVADVGYTAWGVGTDAGGLGSHWVDDYDNARCVR
jgi:hypothetical protein